MSRLTAGMRLQDDAYTNEPGKVPPASLAPDQKLVYPFVRAEWIEDRFQRTVRALELTDLDPTLRSGVVADGFSCVGSSRPRPAGGDSDARRARVRCDGGRFDRGVLMLVRPGLLP